MAAAFRDRITELRRVPARELLPNQKNWRVHPATQKAALSGLLSEIGYADALLARETPAGLVLIDGHLRAEMTPDAVVPVLVLDVTEAEADMVLATLDPLAAMAAPDTEALRSLVNDLAAQTDDALAELLQDIHDLPSLQEEPRSEEPLTEQLEPRAKPGQVWQLGRHRLMCGDSTSPEDVTRLLDGAKPRLMITDPPYGVEYEPGWRAEAAERGTLSWNGPQRSAHITNDDKADWQAAYALSPCEVVYNWSASGKALVTGHALEETAHQLRAMIVWVKPSPVISRGPYGYQHEICWYAVKRGAKADWVGPPSVSTVWQVGWDDVYKAASGEGHAAQKPVELMERPMLYHRGDVYEPFCGSGTTLIAAERQGRTCYAMELEPQFVDMIIARWEQYTGGVAVRCENDGNETHPA